MITGAASGIGRSLARRLSRSGSPVAIADVDETGLKETARSLRGPVLTRVLDVRDAADQHRFAAEVRQWLASLAHGARLAAVFNNAGVAVASSVLDGDPGDDEWLRQINFDGVVNGTRAFLPILVEQDSGVIVNTSSVFGLLGMPNQSAYCASKFAVRGFTDSLRQELRGTGVSAVTVHPGGIRTNIARNARIRKDPEGLGRSHDQMAADFEAITMTTPDKAAQIICRGVEQGKARILVGPDAYVFDALARVAPTHYYDIMARLEKRLRSRQASSSLDRVPGGFGDVLPPGRHGPPYPPAQRRRGVRGHRRGQARPAWPGRPDRPSTPGRTARGRGKRFLVHEPRSVRTNDLYQTGYRNNHFYWRRHAGKRDLHVLSLLIGRT